MTPAHKSGAACKSPNSSGRPGEFDGLFNYELLFSDRVFWTAVWWTCFYTVFATVFKFGLGLWLALLLNNYIPFKSFVRAIIQAGG